MRYKAVQLWYDTRQCLFIENPLDRGVVHTRDQECLMHLDLSVWVERLAHTYDRLRGLIVPATDAARPAGTRRSSQRSPTHLRGGGRDAAFGHLVSRLNEQHGQTYKLAIIGTCVLLCAIPLLGILENIRKLAFKRTNSTLTS